MSELGNVLDVCGFKLASYKLRDLIAEYDRDVKDGRLDFDEFKAVRISNTDFIQNYYNLVELFLKFSQKFLGNLGAVAKIINTFFLHKLSFH